MDNPRNALASGYKLHWYTIKKILGQGGFGITYLAEDTNLNQEVAIKEFLPIEMAVRDQSSSVHPVSGEYGDQFKWGLDRFMSEAQTLAKFKHPNIVRVFTVFPENNTAYMVMEYEHGKGLDELLKNKNTLGEQKLKSIILPILDGLKQVHASGFIHRDIKPANIFIRENGSPVLLDFGSARQSFGEQTRTLTAMISPGFAPFEQYTSKSDKQGPWTDIYGIAATMYRAIIGRSPAEAMDRSESLLDINRDSIVTVSEMSPEGYSSNLLAAIDHGLAFKPEDRPQVLSEWIQEIDPGLPLELSEVETVVATDTGNINQEQEEDDTEKTEVITKPAKKKSLFKRLVKYTLITFAILFVLAILSEEDKKNKKSTAEPQTIEQLLADAEEDIKALRLTKPFGNNAVEKYHAILIEQPDNVDAQQGLFNVSTEYLKLAENNINNNKLDKAESYLNLAKEVFPDHPDIEAIEKILHEDITANRQEESKPSLISDVDKDKLNMLKSKLEENPRDRQARKERQAILDSYQSDLKAVIDSGDYDTAIEFVKEAQTIAPNSVKLKTMLKRLEKRKKEQAK